MKTIDEKMMALALAEAGKGYGRTSPNPMVGAVVVREGEVVAKGYHARAGEPHAEVNALNKAGPMAKGATLYVTLEPCHHQGRTPPCTRAVLAAGIARVVIGTLDPNPKVPGGGATFLKSRGITVETGILEARCRDLNEYFNKFITTGRPFVVLKTAATLDGKVATRTGHSRWITGEKARGYVHRLRDGIDAILVGRGTVDKDDPSLSTRLPDGKKAKHPLRIILDTRLRLPLSARVFDASIGGPTIVACGPDPDREKADLLEARGVRVWPLPLFQGGISLGALTERLGREQISSLLIEGGAKVNAHALLEEKIVDKMLLFYAPKIVGGEEAPGLVGGAGVSDMNECLNIDILTTKWFGPDLLIVGVPR